MRGIIGGIKGDTGSLDYSSCATGPCDRLSTLCFDTDLLFLGHL